MKKQLNLSRRHTGKLCLNKKTISNLTAAEMNRQVGGDKTKGNTCTCPTYNNAYTCDNSRPRNPNC